MKRKLKSFFGIITFLFFVIFLYSVSIYINSPDFKKLIDKRTEHIVIQDRNNIPIWYIPDFKGDIGEYVKLEDVSKDLINALLAAEDHNFFNHGGVEFSAIIRAAYQNIKAGRIVSGGSTITEQVIRRLIPKRRTFKEKFREIIYSIKLENLLTKKEILELYINLLPMGGNIEGVKLASQLYFEKSPELLTISEAASLASLPKSPGRFLPVNNKSFKRFEKRREWLLGRMRKLNFINDDEFKMAMKEKKVFLHFKPSVRKNHFIEMILKKYKDKKIPKIIETTIDSKLEKRVEKLIYSHRERLAKRECNQVASVILDSKSGEVLSLTGSLKFCNRNSGYVNGALAKRSLGSTLKPFLYTLALDNNLVKPSELFSDVKHIYETPRGDYVPTNDSGKSYGPVLLRVALGNSLNQTAIRVLKLTGIENFYEILKELKIINKNEKGGEYYGLGMAIGNVEASLLNLTTAYSVFANEGKFVDYQIIKGKKSEKKSIFSKENIYIISDILSDSSARVITFGNPQYFRYPYPLMFKTGTSTNYRDCWIVSVTPEYIIGIWAGNFSGKPTCGLSGSSACGPILKEIIKTLYGNSRVAKFHKPEDIERREICSISGMKPNKYCKTKSFELFKKSSPPLEICNLHNKNNPFHNIGGEYSEWNYNRIMESSAKNFKIKGGKKSVNIVISYPNNNDRFIIEKNGQNIIHMKVEISHRIDYVRWFVDGKEVMKSKFPYFFNWKMKRGKHKIGAATPDNKISTITIFLH